MPTYEFRCPDGTIIERIFKMSEVPTEIPSPNGDGLAIRIISGGAALLFKGSGFYITDYGKDGKKDQRAASAENASSSDKGSSGDKGASSEKGSSGDKGSSGGESKSASDKPAADKPAASPPSSTKSD